MMKVMLKNTTAITPLKSDGDSGNSSDDGVDNDSDSDDSCHDSGARWLVII